MENHSIEDCLAFLSEMNKFCNDFIENSLLFCKDKKFTEIRKDYKDRLKEIGEIPDISFNIFTLMTINWRHEALHDRVLSIFLNPNGAHNCGYLFLERFIDLIGINDTNDIPKRYYTENVTVERKEGNIDVLIKDNTNERAVIIEDKIHNAIDQEMQLQRYQEYVKNELDYTLDKIVYLTPTRDKTPSNMEGLIDDKNGTQEDGNLRLLTAFDGSENDLYHGWRDPCLEELEKDEYKDEKYDIVKANLKQYGDLLKNIGRMEMSLIIAKEFFQKLEKNEAAYHNANFIYEMMKCKLELLKENLDVFSFFKEIKPWEENCLPYKLIIGNVTYYIVLYIGIEKIECHFVKYKDNKDIKNKEELEDIINNCNIKKEYQIVYYKEKYPRLIWSFNYPSQKKEMIDFVKELAEKVGGYLNKN